MPRTPAASKTALKLKHPLAFILVALTAVACGGEYGGVAAPTSTAARRTITLAGSLTFGEVPVGTTATAVLTVANNGNSMLTVRAITQTRGLDGVLSMSRASGTVDVGRCESVTIYFEPTEAKTYSGILTVHGDQTGGTNTVVVSGAGVPPASTTPQSSPVAK